MERVWHSRPLYPRETSWPRKALSPTFSSSQVPHSRFHSKVDRFVPRIHAVNLWEASESQPRCPQGPLLRCLKRGPTRPRGPEGPLPRLFRHLRCLNPPRFGIRGPIPPPRFGIPGPFLFERGQECILSLRKGPGMPKLGGATGWTRNLVALHQQPGVNYIQVLEKVDFP